MSGSSSSACTPQLSRSDGEKSLSLLRSGCSELLQFQSSPAGIRGELKSRPVRSGDDRSSSGSVTNAPPILSSTTPQLSIANEPPTSITTVHDASLVLRLIATLAMHDAPATLLPHGHWYACTSKRRPSYTPLTSENTPTPWKL